MDRADYLVDLLKKRKQLIENKEKKLSELKEWTTDEEESVLSTLSDIYKEEKEYIDKILKELEKEG